MGAVVTEPGGPEEPDLRDQIEAALKREADKQGTLWLRAFLKGKTTEANTIGREWGKLAKLAHKRDREKGGKWDI